MLHKDDNSIIAELTQERRFPVVMVTVREARVQKVCICGKAGSAEPFLRPDARDRSGKRESHDGGGWQERQWHSICVVPETGGRNIVCFAARDQIPAWKTGSSGDQRRKPQNQQRGLETYYIRQRRRISVVERKDWCPGFWGHRQNRILRRNPIIYRGEVIARSCTWVHGVPLLPRELDNFVFADSWSCSASASSRPIRPRLVMRKPCTGSVPISRCNPGRREEGWFRERTPEPLPGVGASGRAGWASWVVSEGHGLVHDSTRLLVTFRTFHSAIYVRRTLSRLSESTTITSRRSDRKREWRESEQWTVSLGLGIYIKEIGRTGSPL